MSKKIIVIYENVKIKPLTFLTLEKDLKKRKCVKTSRNGFDSVLITASDKA